MDNSLFTVCDEPFCIWGPDLTEENRQFIERIDDKYFFYIASVHSENDEEEHQQQAAIALRAGYMLCLETLFTLMSAALQAPSCIAGWILKATTRQVREFTEALLEDRNHYQIAWSPHPHPIGFNFVAGAIFRFSEWSAASGDLTITSFSKTWERLANDFLNPKSIAEYNSIKHGFRASSGGSHFRIGIEQEYGKAPPESELKYLGGSKFGSSFYSAERVQNAPTIKGVDPHFTLRRHSLNWSPKDVFGRMKLAAMSIQNLKASLLIEVCKQPNKTPFVRPLDFADFETPWETSLGVESFSVARIVDESQIVRLDRDELRKFIEARATPSADGGL